MKCTSCDEEMVFIKENGGYLCPKCGAYTRPKHKLSEEEVQALIDDSLTAHQRLEHNQEESKASSCLGAIGEALGTILICIGIAITMIFMLYGLTSDKENIPAGIVALIQMALLIGALAIRENNKEKENKVMGAVESLLITIAALLVIAFVIVIA